MDKASLALAQGVPPGVPDSFRALEDHRNVPRSTLHARKHGRRSIEEKAQSQHYLTPPEDRAVVDFLSHMSLVGQPVRIMHVPEIAFAATQQRPMQDRPPKPPGKNWAKAFENRHPELKARRVQALDWNRHPKNIYEKSVRWFEAIGTVLQNPDVQLKNIYNVDETGVMLSMPGSVKVLVGKDDLHYRGARVKRTTVTAIETISADGRYLPPMIIWPATTHRSNWTTFPTPGWQYACNESGYSNSKISLEWLKRIFDPQTKEIANKKPRVLIWDGFGGHETLEILEYCFENNILLCRLPSHTSHKLQPCDVAVFGPLKATYREEVDRLERGGVNAIGKQHFTFLYSHARKRAFTPENIKAGFAACGLVPFNSERVLGNMPKPPAALTIPEADEVKVGPHPHDEVLQTPVTPATPLSTEALVSLQNLIIKRDAHALDEASKQSLQRHVQKFVKAAQISFAKGVLQQNQIRFLIRINNEAKVRRSTKSEVLAKGEGKVISYEDLEAARAARAAKEQAKGKGKGKRGRKCKTSVEADVPDSSEERSRRKRKNSEEAGALEPKAKVARMSEARIEENEFASKPWRAPVARMW